jgi:hypothetical protein
MGLFACLLNVRVEILSPCGCSAGAPTPYPRQLRRYQLSGAQPVTEFEAIFEQIARDAATVPPVDAVVQGQVCDPHGSGCA